MPRLFIAIDFPASVVEQIQNICFGIRDARWTPRNQLHLTMRFIGECHNGLFENIAAELDKISLRGFTVGAQGVGYFPLRGNPRIVWVGVKPDDALSELRTSIDQVLSRLEVQEEKKKFHPHVTVARLRDNTPPEWIIPFLADNNLFKTEEFEIKEFHLFSSILQKQGAIHQIEETYQLLES
jgi:2'-5' RNA ligase